MKSPALSTDEKSRLRAVILGISPRLFPLTRPLSSRQREALFVLTAWVYQAYEISTTQDGDPRKTLSAYKEEFLTVWNGNATRHLITLLFVRFAQEYDISKADCLQFLFTLEKSVHPNPFPSRRELVSWLSHTAGFVGKASAQMLELSPENQGLLQQIGIHLGMASILRGVGRNWRLHNRVLLPLSVLEQYELERDQLWNRRHTWQWHQFIGEEIHRLEVEKPELEKQLKKLPPSIRTVITLVLDLESHSLQRLRKQPILAWNILPLRPDRATFFRIVSWWTWRLKGLPKAQHALEGSRTLFAKGRTALQRD